MLRGKNHFLTPAQDWIHDCIWYWHPGLDPEMVSSLEYEYIVTQLKPCDYIYVKWGDGGPVFATLAESEIQPEVENSFLEPKGAGLGFPLSTVILVHTGLIVACFYPYLEIGPKKTGYAWNSSLSTA